MTKILIPIMLTILMIGCSSDKEPLVIVQNEPSTKTEETIKAVETTKTSVELTEFDRCLLTVGMQDCSGIINLDSC